MTNPPEEKLKSLLNYKIDDNNFEFRKWFLKQFDADDDNRCSLEEFAIYFINTVRQYTEVHLKTVCSETPKCQTPVRAPQANNNNTENVFTPKCPAEVDTPQQETSKSTANDSKNLTRSIKQSRDSSFADIEWNSSSRQNSSGDRLGLSPINSTSTPIRANSSKTSRKHITTPSSSSANKSASSNLCLGDFLVLNTPANNRSHKKKTTPKSTQQSASKSQTEKPKKRLQPISISKKVEPSGKNSSIFAGESSFSNENNILKISNNELEDKNQCAIMAARKSLATNASEIAKEIKNILPQIPAAIEAVATSTPVMEANAAAIEIPLDLKNLKNNLSLKRLADIYALIIDLNLTTNILNELSFLLNILNAPGAKNVVTETCNNLEQLHLKDNDSNMKCLALLKDLPNAVYFALVCLENERLSLASLDAKSLGVVLISERFSYLRDDVKMFLLETYQCKQQLAVEKPFCDTSLCFESKACNNVYFQHEQDSRENFSSYQEFTNFRAQRDLFYNCLKIWEANHLNPSWKFSTEITPKVREIFNISENCINMAHLAKLFVSQLLLSATNATSPEEIGLDVDLLKLSKLTQRLIAPSQFSVDYQFPRTEAFFRDFILKARSLAFAEQLKMELYTQLTTLNDSSLDHINIRIDDNDENVFSSDGTLSVVVKPDILNSLLILAKFLGFTISLPYNISCCNAMPANIEKNQKILRAIMQPTFDVYVLLEQAMEQSKLLIAIPWVVQYFAMLDNITLQLDNCMKTLKLLFALYSHLGVESSNNFCVTSVFIIKLCLGWLFESKQFIAEQYYNYRAMVKGKNAQEMTNEVDFVKSKLGCNIFYLNNSQNFVLNAYLESFLPIACPFLAEFRVSIMPAKYAQTKNASRAGGYRHITTKLTEFPIAAPIANETSSNFNQNKQRILQNTLIQAFLHSQSTSTRQIIKFCTERCYKSTIKDGQLKILLPAKTNADNLVNEITSFQYHFVFNSIKTIYDDAYAQVKTQWQESIPKILHKRINNALESLLPEETSSVLKRTYAMIIGKEAAVKISQWFHVNITTDYYFCPNLVDVTNKICAANKNKVQLGMNQLTIKKEIPRVSDLIDELQYWLHCTSIRVERFTGPFDLVILMKNLILSFENELPSVLYQLLAAKVVQLLQNIIAKHYFHLSDELIEVACQVLLHPNMQNALENFSSKDICIFKAFVTVLFIESLGTKTECFSRLTHLIISMIKKRIITVNYVNDLFVSLLKHEWQPLVLAEISRMLKSIAKETSEVPQKGRCDNAINNEKEGENDDEDENEKSSLFMDMLADLSRDVDFF